jgi:RNA polymerase sigma-70 factor, ECF subfamily
MTQIEAEITIRIRRGDERAFKTVFHTLYSPLVYFANEYVGDKETGRNLVQNAFMKLWEKRADLKETENLKSYLYTITRNECISHLRHQKVIRQHIEKNTLHPEDLALNLEALNELDFNQIDLDNIQQIIQQTIDKLPERCREVFVLSRYAQLKNHEIATRLQITEKAVESNITRALKILRENLKDYLPAAILHLLFSSTHHF